MLAAPSPPPTRSTTCVTTVAHASSRAATRSPRVSRSPGRDPSEDATGGGAEANTVRTSRFARHHGRWPTVGIRLYKNCGERMIRRMGHSKRNLLTKNGFVDNDVGIWVGSRQGLPRSASPPFDCRFDSIARDGEVARPSWVDLNYD